MKAIVGFASLIPEVEEYEEYWTYTIFLNDIRISWGIYANARHLAFRYNPDGQEGLGAPSFGWDFRPRSGTYLMNVYTSGTFPNLMLMYGKEASNRKQEIDRQHYTIPNQRPKDKHCGKI